MAAEAKYAEDEAAKAPKKKDAGEWDELKESEAELIVATVDDSKQDEHEDGDENDDENEEGHLDEESEALLEIAFAQLKP